jgi:hypothetical protein
MRILSSLLFLLVLATACEDHTKLERFEGLLIYETDDPMLNNVPVDSGKFIKHYVKGDSVRVESYTAMGKQVHIKDLKNNSGLLIFIFAGQKVALLQDLDKDTLQRGFQWAQGDDSKKIAELKSKNGFISGGYLDKPVEVYFSERYPAKIIDIYDGIIPGLPTEYTLFVQQMPVAYKLVKVEEKPISDELFKVPSDCLVMTMEEFMEMLSNENLYQ